MKVLYSHCLRISRTKKTLKLKPASSKRLRLGGQAANQLAGNGLIQKKQTFD